MLSPSSLVLAAGLLSLAASYQDQDACTAVSGVIVGRGSIAVKAQVRTAGECCHSCHQDSNCIAYTYDTQSQQCFHKDNTYENSSMEHRVSGIVRGRHEPDLWNACAGRGKASSLPFCDESLPMDKRLQDLVERIELGEIASELTARQSKEIPRLGLPAYYWGTNAIHGLQNLECLGKLCPTSFPAPCALSASFDPQIVEAMGQILGVEERAYFNAKAHNSLDTWSPTINLNRDPRWGRNVESAGEDPLVAGLFGAAYTRGLQQEGKDKYLQAAVTLKHWMSYTLENYRGVTRHTVDSKVSAWDMVSSYLPQWEIAVKEAGAKGVMCSYNMVNGRPTCGNNDLTEILKRDFNFTGYITSDTDACGDIYTSHKYVKSGEEAVRECLTSQTDIDSGDTYAHYLQSAVAKGIVNRRYADQALYNSYKIRFELGLFDVNGSKGSKYAGIGKEVIGQSSHQQTSLIAARKAMVLLKNSGVLPAKKGQKVAVIGQAANYTEYLLGNYNGPICTDKKYDCFPSIFQEIVRLNGPSTTLANTLDVREAVAAAGSADFVVLIVDNFKDGGGEGLDRERIDLDPRQHALAKAVLALQKPAALVLVNGGIIAIDELKDSAPAILEAFMPGVHGGQAIAETIFGDSNPGGKMPVTMYHSSYVDEVDFTDMSMVAGPGRSYKFYKGVPLFPFGFGLSYSTFALAAEPSDKPIYLDSASSVMLDVTVSNTGKLAGDEVVFAYVTNESDVRVNAPMPIRSLLTFQRVHLAVGEAQHLRLELQAKRFALVDSHGVKKVLPGRYSVQVDRGHGDVLKFDVQITGETKTLFKLKPWWNMADDSLPGNQNTFIV